MDLVHSSSLQPLEAIYANWTGTFVNHVTGLTSTGGSCRGHIVDVYMDGYI